MTADVRGPRVAAGTPDPVPALVAALKERRRALRLSQGAIAEMLSVSKPTVTNWELGTRSPHLAMLAAYARAVGAELAVEIRPVPAVVDAVSPLLNDWPLPGEDEPPSEDDTDIEAAR